MKYYLIAGEASGDLHASNLMKQLAIQDPEADFRFFGGDLMAAVGGVMVMHYRELAYMGFIPVLLHLHTIAQSLSLCKSDIQNYCPDVVILVDYPGFNLRIAKFLKTKTQIPAYYYISPKIWAWKEYRIKNIKRDIAEMFSILPFEIPFYEGKHRFKINYVGNPTAQEIREFKGNYSETREHFCRENHLSADRPIIAILAGSRKQEIKRNLPVMLKSLDILKQLCPSADNFQIVVSQAPGIQTESYNHIVDCSTVQLFCGHTYRLLSHSAAALVVSGTATLETALLGVPQVVVYDMPLHPLIAILRKVVLKVRFVSLVNLVADEEVVPEQIAEKCTPLLIAEKLIHLCSDTTQRKAQMQGYRRVRDILGTKNAPQEAARIITEKLKKRK
ncbi:MAG: lipid-A-disaccharide synthase [Bacteroidaceae bacterium]|nr:lipid-A-disaccharide synthase [Bacteroidaceae bacterium]